MQTLIIGMWSKRKQDFQITTRWIFYVPRGNRRPTATYRYRAIQKNVQDGSVWLMIGKLQLKWQDKVSFAPILLKNSTVEAEGDR
jgi:hypothetical protein